MITITRSQRVALKRIYDRRTIWPMDLIQSTAHPDCAIGEPLTYRQFRKKVQPAFMADQTIGVPWCGIWLGIEPDGYVHS